MSYESICIKHGSKMRTWGNGKQYCDLCTEDLIQGIHVPRFTMVTGEKIKNLGGKRV